MIGVCLMAFMSSAFASITKAPPTDETSPTQASPITINPKLRKALLEALSNYDGDDSTEAFDDETSTISSTTEEFDDTTNNPTLVKIHTFAIDGDKSDENEVIKTIIITRPRTTLTPPKEQVTNSIDDEVEIKFGKTPDPVNDKESNKADNIQLVRSVEARNSANVEKKEEKPKKKASEKSVTKPITPIPTTTTLPPPVTNADGDNIEKVEDLKIQQAPLLAAFTVEQDINGQPNKVISLFKNQQSQVSDKKIFNMQFKASQPIPSPTTAPVTTVQASTANSNLQQLSNFELKQRQLEEQIRFLQVRQREQDEIIRRHQLLQDQQNRQQQQRNRFDEEQQQRNRFEEEQRQRQRFEEEQRQRQRFDQEQAFVLRQQQQAQQVQQPQTQALIAPPSSVNVQFIPSIPVGHTVGISVEQQLPFKGPSEFNPDNPDLQKSFQQLQQNFQFRQFQQQQQRNAAFNQQQPVAQALIQKQEVQQLPTFTQLTTNLELPVRNPSNFIQFSPLPTNLELPQKPFQTFNSAPLAVLPSITEVAPQGQGRTRVFRQDASQTGNFGFNNNQNFQFQQQQINPVESTLDNQLQNLFHQSGISTRSTEDIGIISKILSLNHGVPNDFLYSNRGRFQ